MPFSTERLLAILRTLPEAKRYWIAYSGGMDSHVLLAGLASLGEDIPGELLAVHVNHGISPHAQEWVEHNRRICTELEIAFHLIDVDASSPGSESPEAWARQLRYQALEECIGNGEILLTAHHRDDQVETLLLQLLRGAGPMGLAAMPSMRPFGIGVHARPLLAFDRVELNKYAAQQGLDWIEDDTNQNIGYDRNYLRQQVIPALKKRWPNLGETLSRATVHQADSAALLEDLAIMDMAECLRKASQTLRLEPLLRLSTGRQANLIRYWLRSLQLPVPDEKKLQRILVDVLGSKYDAVPCVSWPGAEVRRYREHIVAARPLLPHDEKNIISWDLNKPCELTDGLLKATRSKGNGIKLSSGPDEQMTIRYRSGGEVIQPAGRQHHHELKKLFQEAGVPPWFRDRIPLLFIQDKLAAVAGFWIDEAFNAGPGEDAWQISWTGLERIILLN